MRSDIELQSVLRYRYSNFVLANNGEVHIARLGATWRTPDITAGVGQLDQWAFNRSKGTKDAAIACLRPQQLATALALVEVQARIGGHGLSRRKSAIETCKHGLQDRWRMHCVASNVGIQRLPQAVRCNDSLGVIGLALGLHPSSIGKHDRGFNLPRRDRPVCSKQAILIYV